MSEYRAEASRSSVAIVGGGASGVLAALRLLTSDAARQGRLEVVLINSRPVLGAGVAYSTDEPFHLLNVATGRMGAFAEDPEDFQRWLKEKHPEETRTFVPRRLYREYLGAKLAEATTRLNTDAFRRIPGRATTWSYGARGIKIEVENSSPVVCDRILIATGYRECEPPDAFRGLAKDARFVHDIWNHPRPTGPEERMLVLGNGLSAVDFLLRTARSGHRGPILAVSRKGLRPLSHLPPGRGGEEKIPDLSAWTPLGPRAAIAEIRRIVAGLDSIATWPTVIDRVRSEIHRIWERWELRQKRRFLRHLRSYWDAHRHRVAPEVVQEWDSLLARGFFTSRAGRISEVEARPESIRVTIQSGTRPREILDFDRVVNCTGVVPDLSFFSGHALIEDPLALGIETDAVGRPIDSEGRILEGVYLLGPALRPYFWEMTAIPELRQQALVACDALLKTLEV